MRPTRGRPSVWTIIATVAGVLGAAAGLYPIVFAREPELVHLTGSASLVFAEAVAEPVLLTGKWRITRIGGWSDTVIAEGRGKDRIVRVEFTNRRVPSRDEPLIGPKPGYFPQSYCKQQGWHPSRCDDGKTGPTLVADVAYWELGDELSRKVGISPPPSVTQCDTDMGNFRIGFEFKHKTGLGWAYLRLPYCVGMR
jgi:hypothetical protein